MKSFSILLAAATLLAPAAVSSADPQGTAPVSTKAAPDPNRQICKSEDMPGSLIQKKKICMSAADWKEKAARDGQWVEHQSTYNSQPNGR